MSNDEYIQELIDGEEQESVNLAGYQVAKAEFLHTRENLRLRYGITNLSLIWLACEDSPAWYISNCLYTRTKSG